MSKIKKKDSKYYNTPSSRLSKKNKNKIAYICIGRWQPPHKGHEILIKKTLELALANNGHAFVYIFSYSPSSSDDWLKDKTQKEIISYARERRIKKILYLQQIDYIICKKCFLNIKQFIMMTEVLIKYRNTTEIISIF